MAMQRSQDQSGRMVAGTEHHELFPGRRELVKRGVAAAGAVDLGIGHTHGAGAQAGEGGNPRGTGLLDAKAEAKKIAFDRVGTGEPVLLISGFPQTRLSWHRLIPLLTGKYQPVPADLPSFGDSGILSVPASTENVGRVFHEFVAGLSAPLHVVAHDFGAWVAYSWAPLFPEDFKSLTLIEAGIPGITLTNDIQLSDYKRKWNFIFMMLPDLPAELVKGKEDAYVGWWYKNKVYKPGAIPPSGVAKYIQAYARDGRMDAAFDYCRNIVNDMEFNKRQFKSKLPMRLLAVGGSHSIPTMGDSLRPYFDHMTSVVIPDSGHFVPEEQPQALARALLAFL
jgi:pimeloyl-ACP methyl ester carboxylesterase